MKKISLKLSAMLMASLLFAFITSCSSGTEEQKAAEIVEEPEMGEMEMMEEDATAAPVVLEGEPTFLVEYVEVKNALFQDDYEQAKAAAAELQEALEGNGALEEAQISELQATALQIAEAEDIKTLRRYFAELSQELYEVVQNNELTEQVLYWQHCPMALGGEGANWLSYEEQIQNPFMGQRMPGCGSVAETIN
ncbi:DUF3347 domain-containing protein [Nafulsella turpanensis]|uniref:DUF3347 domain-containing protein n=1 Tax=Nafulsella turpanensis TaxID=1265690 RepID=UPI00135F1119|nr:DUF3347 domain-containing protein [Nafulsella turpanensis]